MKKFISIFLLSFVTAAAPAQSLHLPPHPRVLVRGQDLPALRENFFHKDFDEIRKSFEKEKQYKTEGISPDGFANEQIRQKIESLAYSYLLHPDSEKAAASEAIRLSKAYLQSINNTEGYHQNAQAYFAVFTTALVYDWCYSLLSASDKSVLLDQMLRVSCLAEYCIFKNTPRQYLSGHYGEYAPTVFLAMGLAVYDERPDIFEFAYKEQVDNFAPSRNPWYEAGTHHQGSQYIHVRYGNELFQAYLLQQVGLSPYSANIGLTAFRELYANVPQEKDMDGMPEGDCHNNITMGDHYIEFLPLAARMSHDPHLQTYARLNLSKLVGMSTRALIYYDPNIKADGFETLPLSRFFGSPSGIMIARTGWDLDKKNDDSKAMIVLMNMREYTAKNHVHLDVGHFSIFYKGHLALDAGIYQGKDEENGWGKTNYVNYYARTIAHNSLLILDPDEPTPYEGSNKKAVARDGGQFSFKNRAFDSIQEMYAAGKQAQILAEEIAPGAAPDYSYLKGDMTRCYNVPANVASYPAKADTVRRSFVFLNFGKNNIPGALIVLDKVVSTNPSFKKTWLLHTQNEPRVKDNQIEALNTTAGRNGKLVCTVLLPSTDNIQVATVGGPGKEYWVDGKNWGSVTQEDAGQWRIEVSPKTAARSDNFLNVLQAMDAYPSVKPLPMQQVLSTNRNYVAVVINDRIVAQQLALANNKADIDFDFSSFSTAMNMLMTDLAAGKWKITIDGVTETVQVGAAGTLYHRMHGGHIHLSYLHE